MPQTPQLDLSLLVVAQCPPQQVPLWHWMSFVHVDDAPLASLVAQPEVLVLQYWSELHEFLLPVPQAPAPLQAEDMTPLQSVEQVSGQDTSACGKTQPGLTPSHFLVPQVPEPPQELRGVVTDVQLPGVALHDWHKPSHFALQQ